VGLILFFLFIVLPIAEIYVIIQVAGAIGWIPTLFLLILDGFAGAALARSQGRAAWERFNLALSQGRVPAHETFDGAMIILGGSFLLAPGFITDVIGFALLIPPTRAIFRAVVARLAKRRVAFGWAIPTGPPRAGTPRAGGSANRGYDYEGTAREVHDPAAELDPGERDG
jgi:UPF0716 protein FxsA